MMKLPSEKPKISNPPFYKLNYRKYCNILGIILLFLGFLSPLISQDMIHKLKRPNKIALKIFKSEFKIKGYLNNLPDSSIIISNKKNLHIENKRLTEYKIPNVEYIQYTKEGAKKMGAIIGACTGVLAGIVIGAVSGDYHGSSGSTMGLLLGVAIAVPTSIVGALIGSSIKVKIPINGSYSKYNENKKLLDPFLLE